MAKTDDNAIYVEDGKHRIRVGTLIVDAEGKFIEIKQGRKTVQVTLEQFLLSVKAKVKE